MDEATAPQAAVERLYEIAERQAGYFSTAQAREAGVSQRQLTYYVRSGRLARVRWGVYRLVNFPATPNEDLVVAWLQVGREAVISHDSALALYGLSDALPARIHLTVPRSASRRRAGLALHTGRLRPDEVTEIEGLPVTTVPRTMADVAAGGLAEELVVQAVQEAIARGLVEKGSLRAYAGARKGRFRRLLDEALRERVR